MPTHAFRYTTLLEYTEREHALWREWFTKHPEALDLPFADGKMATVGGLLVHIFGVELRYAERVNDLPVSSYDEIYEEAGTTVDSIFAFGKRARGLLRTFIERANEQEMAQTLTFQTLTAGVVTASKQKIASNVFLHETRHWGQLATVLRQAGYTDQWGHDFLLSPIPM